MDDVCILGVPVADENELIDLVREVQLPGDVIGQRYFDGTEFAEFLIPIALSASAWRTVEAWIKSRVEMRKAVRVSGDGIIVEGVRPSDIEKILAAMHRMRNLPLDD